MDDEAHFGTRLRKLRMEQHVSLGELSRRTHYSKGYLSKIEAGLRPPSPGVVRLCDGALGLDGLLIRAEAAVVPALSRAYPASATDPDERWVLQMEADGSFWFQPVDRRSAMALGATALISMRPRPAPGVTQAQEAEVTLRAFTSMFPEMRRLGQLMSPTLVLPSIIPQTRTIQLVAARSSGRVRSDLLVLASRYAEYAGWMAQESGEDKAALWWTDRAVTLASEGGDEELAAYSLVRRALVTLYTSNARETVELAQAAQRHPGASRRVRGLAAQREAQGHALAGSASDCFRALDVAYELLDDDVVPTAPVLGTSTVRNPVHLSRAWCLLDLGKPVDAAEAIERELRDTPASAHRFRARWLARQALAYATAQEVDQACGLARALLDDFTRLGSATIRSDLSALARTLSRWLNHPHVRTVYPDLVDALR
ncbi:helix-turn-helix domain-containing protein [Amycolatopsis sp. Hca4]|uniref:helix-turn-helix domain-containing protein n=1 Tax=Amycolatopsis sp. Hca4 TaxID=2742131 RepID=UPI0015900A9A|nr:helix-turn-helix transcriptional regulator [Amycolatopsis sp. Hca4]QKV75290.1 helix-turn-helix transcriptional regulator [Amycolatopsis sp. Hca4]